MATYTLTASQLQGAGILNVFDIPDANAQAYLTATGISDTLQQNIVAELVRDLKNYGIWSKMKAVYPFVTDNRNLWSFTNDMTAGNWVRSGFTATANTTTAPDGTSTADTLIENTSSGVHYISNQTSAIALSNGNCTMSIYVKKIVRDWFVVSLYDGTTGRNAWFNINTGVVGTVQSGATASISDAGNGWYRCSITMPMSASNVNFTAYYGADADNSVSYTGNGLASYYVWGAQLEIGSLSTYQPIATTQQAFISNQFKYNLVNPVDSDAAFRLVFNGGWTFSTNGALPNGVNSYGDTKLLPSSVLSLDSAHVSFYSRTNNNTVGYDIGAANVPSNSAIEIVTRWSNDLAYYSINKTEESIANSDSRGYFIASRTASNSTVLYKNSSVLTSSSLSSQTLPTCNIFISAINLGGTPTASSTKQAAFATIGDGLTDTEAANLYTAVQAFQTKLSRQV